MDLTLPYFQIYSLLLVFISKQGQFDQAEAIYRQILTITPENSDALHLLGVIALQAGNHQGAVDMIGQALKLTPMLQVTIPTGVLHLKTSSNMLLQLPAGTRQLHSNQTMPRLFATGELC